MKTAGDPKKLLELLLAREPLPFAEEAQEKARTLAMAPGEADPVAVSQLPEPLALAVLEAAVRARAYPLAVGLSESPARSLAKAAKRALYQLRSLGVATPDKKAEPAAVASPSSPEEPLASLVSAITSTGQRGLIVARPQRGRVEVMHVAFSDEDGVVEFERHELSRGAYRRMLRDAKRPGAPTAVEISLEEAKALLAEAAGTNLRSRTPFPEGLDAALRHLGATPSHTPGEVPPPEEGDASLAVRSAALHDEPEIAHWLPPPEEIQRLALRAQEIGTSTLYIDDQQRAQQLSRSVHSLAEAFFAPEVRRTYGRRLWAMGVLYERLGRSEAARVAKAEARRLYHSAPGLFSPFAVRLFEKVLVAPPRAEAQAERAAEHRSPGGLILP